MKDRRNAFLSIRSALEGLIGLFALPLAQVIGWVAWLFLGYMTGVVGLFSALPLRKSPLDWVQPLNFLSTCAAPGRAISSTRTYQNIDAPASSTG